MDYVRAFAFKMKDFSIIGEKLDRDYHAVTVTIKNSVTYRGKVSMGKTSAVKAY